MRALQFCNVILQKISLIINAKNNAKKLMLSPVQGVY